MSRPCPPIPGSAPASVWDETGTLARLAIPIALAQFGQNAISLVDVAIIGHASSVDLGGASIGRSINFAGVGLGIGVAAALEPLASQAVGARDEPRAWRALLASLLACVVVWVPCSVLAYASTFLLGPLGVEPALIAPTRAFLVPQIPGMLAFSVFLAGKAFLQAHRRTAPALVAAVLANVVNLVVCNLLVRGDEALVAVRLPPLGLPRLGAFGAGLASTVAMTTLAGWVLRAAMKLRHHEERSFGALPVRKVLQIGAPVGFQVLAEIGVFSLVAVLAGRLGRVAVSAHQIAIGLASFTFMGALGISGATAVRVGHAIGERRSARAPGLVGIAIGGGFMLVSAIGFLLFRRALVGVFTADEEVIDLGAQLLVIAAAFQLFDGIQVVAAGALRGAADVRFPFVANVGAHWLVGFPLALLFGFGRDLGATGLWIGLLAGLVVVSLLLLGRFVMISGRTIEEA